ncbi:flagellar basal body rod protein FlgC [Cohnella lubricantis]|uniref:Flagellar basal-body rod protein FlgC n=1 Tax=Cohnella lubricantis TaxID=2163172 RepID=A0A841TJP2_9BACL|nr:flagellar basal body rod protein FlgC [Cohnella lubricantis]MBB6679420.1 flagellar basal body rod protein FlgC [Cohnella lubricantis]MBP2117502.1 flagellar basal-body rod protein FlgC [Cohnella lubricantis]
MKLSGFDISASALTAQRLRMDVISSNIANAETTRAAYVNGEYVPYRRKEVVMEPVQSNFSDILNGKLDSQGVQVTQIKEDPAPFKQVYNPTSPDADENGMVNMPNVDILKEMVDMISASRSYEANVTAMNASKAMFVKSLEIGRA